MEQPQTTMKPEIKPEEKALIMEYMVLQLLTLKPQGLTNEQKNRQQEILQNLGMTHEQTIDLGESELV